LTTVATSAERTEMPDAVCAEADDAYVPDLDA
jgi:hypothetical protein